MKTWMHRHSPLSHKGPCQPSRHWHWYPFNRFTQLAPFMHGRLTHSSISATDIPKFKLYENMKVLVLLDLPGIHVLYLQSVSQTWLRTWPKRRLRLQLWPNCAHLSIPQQIHWSSCGCSRSHRFRHVLTKSTCVTLPVWCPT